MIMMKPCRSSWIKNSQNFDHFIKFNTGQFDPNAKDKIADADI